MKPERWQHIDKLLGEALELDSSRRAAFLDQACAADDELRRKIDALLAAHEQAENFIEAPAITVAAEALAEETRSMVGRPLGNYEILALVGAGGMGAVWKAKDTRLDRAVAIKTLPGEFERHPDRLARFEREAKLLASLNHPNIAAIHGLDEDRGRRFLVLEFVEGETLADRLRRGAIPLDESLKLVRQIADALEAAHEKGVIHRDLKPTNIKITGDGIVKVLDFGLAKTLAGDEANADTPGSPPLGIESTEPRMILGTAAYMAPEQARGKKVDRRADIWAFGVVLYEMVTGTRPFEGTDTTETMASVVTKEPDFEQVPAPVRRLLRKCLEKDPKNRLRDIGDAWELLNDSPVVDDAAHSQVGRRDALRWIWASLSAILAVVLSFRWLKPARLPELDPRQIPALANSLFPLGTPAISDDDRKLAYTVVDPDGVTRLHVRSIMDEIEQAFPGTEGAIHPFWRPGGGSLAFAAGSWLKRLDLEGGSLRNLIFTGAGWQGAWNQNDDILVRGREPELRLISAKQGAPTPIPISPEARFPAFLPDGERFLALVRRENGSSIQSSIQLCALRSAGCTLVKDDVVSAPILAPTPGGKTYLLFLREPGLMAQEFDEASGKVLGKEELLVRSIGRVGNPAVLPAVGVSPRFLAYQNADDVVTQRLKWVDQFGQPVHPLSPNMFVRQPRLSPDQSSVAGLRDKRIWITDLERETSDPTEFSVSDGQVVWSDDSSRLAFLSEGGIQAIDVRGGGKPELLTKTRGYPTSWVRGRLAYTLPRPQALPRSAIGKIYLLDVRTAKSMLVGSPNGNFAAGELSPDGNYIAFTNDRSGNFEVYVQPTTPGAEETRVSTKGGGLPRWNNDGKELFFVSLQGDLMAVDIGLGDTVSVGKDHVLFHLEGIKDGFDVAPLGYDVFRNRRQFLYVSPGQGVHAPITVVENWWVQLEK